MSVRAFVEAAGTFIEHWGFKRIQGEIWALVYLSETPLTASEVAQALGVSKALVSLAMGQLLEFRVLLLTEGGDARSQRLVPNEKLGEAIAAVLRLRERRLLDDAKASIESLRVKPAGGTADFTVEPRRVAAIERLVADARSALDFIVMTLERREN